MMIMVQTGHKSVSQMRDKLRRMREDMEELEDCIAATEAKEETSRGRMRDYDYDDRDYREYRSHRDYDDDREPRRLGRYR